MRILITGGAGCLGSNLIEHWLAAGHEIATIDNFATGKREVVPAVAGLTVHEGSIADGALVQTCFARFRPEVVVHAAAAYKDPDDWVEDAQTNVIGSAHVARAAKACGVQRLINFQTALCYGRPRQLPIPASHFVDGNRYRLQRGDREIRLLVHKAPSAADNPAALAAWMARKGCEGQAMALLQGL